MTDTQTEQVSMREEMLAMANAQMAEVKEEPKAEPEAEAPEVEGDNVVDEADKQVEENDSKEESEDKNEEAEEIDFPLIPKDFSKEEKEAFQKLLDSEDEDMQLGASVLIERYENMKKAFYAKTKDIAEERKSIQGMNEVFKPVEGLLKQQGFTNVDFSRALINEYIQLNQNPAEKIKTWVKQYNLKPSQLGFDDYDDFDYNDIDEAEVREVKKENPQFTAEQIRNEIKISQFEEATDHEGKLMHPYFSQVRATMGLLISKDPSLTLKQAYDKALKIDGFEADKEPELDEFKTDFNAIRERAKKAQKASKSIKTNSGKLDFSKMTIGEELAARLGKS